MRPDILVVGQGLAGTLLAWELERAGVPFLVVDRGHATAATMAAAGIINPVTGRRLVKSWRADVLLPQARAKYRELEAMLGIEVWRDMRVRRLFADERERQVFAAKDVTGELAPYAVQADDAGFWIEGAARIELAVLLGAARERWHKQGKLRVAAVEAAAEAKNYQMVIDCTGVAGAREGRFAHVPWEFSKGEMLELSVTGLTAGVILNRRHWLLPINTETAWVGATHEPGHFDTIPSDSARAALEASARALLARGVEITGHRAGVRVNLPDKHAVAGRHPANPRLGVCNGLGAKGGLVAPELARQWVCHLTRGDPFEAEFSPARFAR
ncbi:MAG: hypothetical protein RIQ93_892 [Verrucomicrobiota bacterium]|jgi:glycine/D-amino acid oxidase-like deaminating enzyme